MRHDLRDTTTNRQDFEALTPNDRTDRANATSRDPDRETHTRQPLVPADHLDLPTGFRRERVRTHDATYLLRGPQSQTLAILGTFRAVEAGDLDHYTRDTRARDLDLRSLKRQALIASERLYTLGGHRVDMLALTDRGKSLLEDATRKDIGQRYYAGFVRWRDMRHEAAIYRMYQEAAARLESSRARIHRIVLDAEIRSQYQRDLRGRVSREAAAQAAELPIVNGHLMIPDLRIEYDTQEGERRHLDLELTTACYSRGQMSAKERAGFVLYRHATDPHTTNRDREVELIR